MASITPEMGGRRKSLAVYAELHEKLGDKAWKWIARTLQIISAGAAIGSIIVLLIIQKEVNNINVSNRKIDRSIELAKELNLRDELSLFFDEFIYEMDKYNELIRNKIKNDENRGDYMKSLIHRRVIDSKNSIIERVLTDHLRTYNAIAVCLDRSFCDEETIRSLIDIKVLDTYIYLRPLFLCDPFYLEASLEKGLLHLVGQFYENIPLSYPCEVVKIDAPS